MSRTYRCEVPVTLILSDNSNKSAKLGYPDVEGNCIIFDIQDAPVQLDLSTLVIIPPDTDEGYIDSEGSGSQFELMRTGVLMLGYNVSVSAG